MDTETLALYLNTTPRIISHLVTANRLQPLGRWRDLKPGRPRMWFDLDEIPDDLVDADGVVLTRCA